MKDAKRKTYICAVTLEHVQFFGPFKTEMAADNWGATHLESPRWNTVSLFSHDVAMPVQLVPPS